MSKKLDVSKLEGYPYTDGGKLEIVGIEALTANDTGGSEETPSDEEPET